MHQQATTTTWQPSLCGRGIDAGETVTVTSSPDGFYAVHASDNRIVVPLVREQIDEYVIFCGDQRG